MFLKALLGRKFRNKVNLKKHRTLKATKSLKSNV